MIKQRQPRFLVKSPITAVASSAAAEEAVVVNVAVAAEDRDLLPAAAVEVADSVPLGVVEVADSVPLVVVAAARVAQPTRRADLVAREDDPSLTIKRRGRGDAEIRRERKVWSYPQHWG